MVSDDEALAIKTRVAPQLLALPGVTAVGLGSKEIGGQPTGELALKVFIEVKRDAGRVPAEELIPAEIDGLPTDVIESGKRHLVVDPPGAVVSADRDMTRSRPMVGGGGSRARAATDMAPPAASSSTRATSAPRTR